MILSILPGRSNALSIISGRYSLPQPLLHLKSVSTPSNYVSTRKEIRSNAVWHDKGITVSTVATRSCKAGYFIEEDDKGRCSSAFLKNLTGKRGGALSPRGSRPSGGALSPRGSRPSGQKNINNLPFYLPFFTYLLCFVVFFWIVGFQRSFEYVLFILPWMCFCYTFPSSFHLLCCWFTLRNLALGKFSFCLRNLLFFTKFKSVNFF